MRYLNSLLILILLFVVGCGDKGHDIMNLKMLHGGKTFAVPTGTVADQFVLKKYPDAVIEYYNSVLDCAIAVRDGKADAAVYDLPILMNVAAKNEGLRVLPELLFDDQYGFAVQLQNNSLKGVIDEVLAELRKDGTYDDMTRRWFPSRGNPAPMPEIPLPGTNGVLRFGTAAVTEPMSFYDSSRRVVGFDIEFASRIAAKLGKSLEIVDMEFGAMLPALIAGKVDMIGAGLSITKERAKTVLFSQCYYKSGIAVMVAGDQLPGTTPASGVMKSLEDIKTKRIGVLLGSVHDTYATKNFPQAVVLQYQNISDMLFALNSDKTDVAFYDHESLKDVFRKNEALGILLPNLFTVPIGAGFNQENDRLRESFNAFLKEIKEQGIYDDMVDRWMKKGIEVMPEIKTSGRNGQLRAGVVSDLGMPFSLMKEGRLVGFDIELSTRFAASMGKEMVPVDLQFGSLLASVSTNKIDIITSSLMITDERKKQIDFSDPYYESGVSVIARKDRMGQVVAENSAAGQQRSGIGRLWTKISDSFYSNILLEKRYLHIIDGLKVTIIISLLAAILGTLIGGLVCFMRMSKNRFLSGFAGFYIMLLRGMPVLVLLMIIYYIVFASVNIDPVFVSVIAFGLNFGAYVSEMFRTSLESIDKGQKEAAIAGGFTRVQTFWYILLPQALRSILPVYKGEFISLLKMTSIVGYIAVQDLTKASDIIRSRTFDAFFPLFMVAIIYLALAWLMAWLLGRIEISVKPKRTRVQSGKEGRV
ncbi:MAG: ABC transporter substrate-binding protein/permease [Bacteroidales bacterium]|nr:ABC transporter substrate-binding protein/permease [Bacteroidales bacterium]